MAAIEGDATSGTVGSAILPVTKVIEEVTGLDLPQDVAASEEFKSLASNLQILSTGPLKGAVSDFEQRLVAETQAGLGDSREGRGRKLQTLKAITETAVQRANLQSELISQGTDRVAARKQAFEQIPTPAALAEGGSSPKGDSDKKRLKFNPATGGFE
jgi:hypothetical protein